MKRIKSCCLSCFNKGFLLPVVQEEVLHTVVHHSSSHAITKSIPFSDDTARRRIEEMAEDIKESLRDILKKQKFGLQLDESTLLAIKHCSWVMLVL